MKKLLQTLLLTFVITGLRAQFVYSTVWSDYSTTYTLTSGFSTTTTPGVMWCGYHPQLNLGNYPWWPQNLNIMVRGYGFSSLWASYKVYEGNPSTCTGPMNQILNGRGVSMSEVSYQYGNGQIPNGPIRYVMAGSYNNGCYFIGVTSVGTPSASMLYPFQNAQAPNKPLPGRPVIIQDDTSSDFFISGSFNGELYVNRVDINGNLIWSMNYQLIGNAEPKDLVIYPGSPSRLLIAGVVEQAPNDEDGFLMSLDVNTGNCYNTQTYGNAGFNDGFNTVLLAAPKGPGSSANIICAGYTESSFATRDSWIVETDLSGSVFWTEMPQPTSGLNYGIVDMLCRENTWQVYEYYALVHSASGMVVLKLDKNGQPFSPSTLAPNNEYVYNLLGTTPSLPAAISMLNSPTNGPNLGIQVYGTANNIPSASTSHMVEAYFNGVTGCNSVLQLQNMPQPTNINTIPGVFFASPGLTSCNNFSVQVLYPGGAMNFPCTGYIVSGDNSRNIATQIEEVTDEEIGFSVQPNPAANKSELTFSAQINDQALVVITDVLGREITRNALSCNYSGDYTHQLNLEGLKDGVYFVNLNLNGNVFQKKLVVSN